MRKLATLAAAAALVLGFAGSAAAEAPTVVNLQAGNSGGFSVGTVSVHNDDIDLTVTYTITEAGWEILETHLAVDTDPTCAGVPQTGKGNPKIGKFPDFTSFEPGDGVKEVTRPFSLNDLGAQVDDDLCIAAHALVAMVDSEFVVTVEESAWGDGDLFANDRNWSMYFIYTVPSHD